MSSPSPENLSPFISPATSPSLSQSPSSLPPPQISAPFHSPLPLSLPVPTATPPSLPPVISPADGGVHSLPPVISHPPPVTTLSPPLFPSPPAPAPETATAPPPLQLPVSPPFPLVNSPPPPPLLAPPPHPSETAFPLSPAPESPPPQPAPEPPSPRTATPLMRQVPRNPNAPPPSTPSITLSPPPVAEIIPSPSSNSSPITSPPVMHSPPQMPSSSSSSPPLPSFFPSPLPSSPANGSLPAAVQIQKPEPNVKFSPGFIVGFAVVAFVVVAALLLAVACVCQKRSRRRRSLPGLPKATSLGPKDSFNATTLPQQPHLRLSPNPFLLSDPIESDAATTTTTSAIDSEPNIPCTHQSNFSSSHGIFTYDQLVAATNGFSESNLVGEGGFGYVYKGVLPSGKEVAVKQLRTGSQQGEREFQAEVDIIGRVHHKHLVSLVGYCITGAERLLVYEFVPNYTLEFHLHGAQQQVMEWGTRLKIAIGSAKGLAYLHEDCNPKIIHRDIKASNILLDFRFEAKVSDFGLAKSFSDTNTNAGHMSTRVVGTFGYLAPEYASSGKVTEKSDVYSYGVMLLELITGRRPISSIDPKRNQALAEWARPLLAQALEDGYFDILVDPRLQRNYNTFEMSRMVSCAAACVCHSAWLRPRMIQIVHVLEGHASLMDVCEGIMPGSSTLYSSPSSNYNVHQYKNDLNKFNITVADQEFGNGMYSGSTSEYALNPSISSTEAHQTHRN